ncbi:DUF5110 domain-containing protein [bacterium]|nr:MAG: DUF5110 domain-containing protein [bacterium]
MSSFLTMTRSTLVPAIAFTTIILSPLVAVAAPKDPIVIGKTRFTVVSPNCIRIEQSQNGKFVDAPSLFAVNRNARFTGYKTSKTSNATTIDTGAIRLSYTDDGQPLSASNLSAVIKGDNSFGTKRWTPASKNRGNLGGTTSTLDLIKGPVDTGDGVLSRDGWYLLNDSGQPLLTKEWVQARPADAGSDWYLFGYGHDYKAALKAFTTIGGEVPLPRKTLLGTWYSRFWAFSSTDYRNIVKEYRQHDFPLDNMVLDMDWHNDGWTGWSWNRKLLPDAEKLMADLHAEGLTTDLNLHPADGVGPQEDRYKEYMAAIGRPANGQTEEFDVANKTHMDALFSQVMAPLKKDGVDFWWLDWQQYPNTRSIPSLTNLWWFNEILMRDTQEGGSRRGVAFSRWAGWGDHRHPIHFSGDSDTGWDMLAFQVPYTAMAGNIGCFFWSHDIGGHMGGAGHFDGRNEESYARWCQFGALSAALRSHSTRDANTDRRPWLYAKWAEDSMRISFHLRSELFPYIYTSTAQSSRDSVPLTRPLYIDAPTDDNSYRNAQEYLFGDNLLVAPIVSPGVGPGHVAHQSVYFPRGSSWFNTFTGEKYDGGSEALCAGTVDELPLFAKGGVPIPMQPYTERMTTSPLSTLRLRAFPGEDGQTGTSRLYEDDGDSQAYKTEAFATTPLSYTRNDDTVEIKIGTTKGSYRGQLKSRVLRIELPATQKATAATVDGKTAAITYDAATATNVITVPSTPISKAVSIKVTAADADFAALANKAQAIRMTALTGRTFTPQSSRDLLKNALAGEMTGEQTTEAMAIVGVGMVRKNLSPTFINGEIRDVFYAADGVLDGVPAVNTSSSSRANIRFNGRTLILPNALIGSDNLARSAKVTLSGIETGYSEGGINDLDVSGYPDNAKAEWASGQKEGSTVRLTWPAPQSIDHIALYDRVNLTDHVTSGTLTFSDGSTVPVGELPNDGATPAEIRFAPKTVAWVEFKVTAVSADSKGVGLAEMAVFSAKN